MGRDPRAWRWDDNIYHWLGDPLFDERESFDQDAYWDGLMVL